MSSWKVYIMVHFYSSPKSKISQDEGTKIIRYPALMKSHRLKPKSMFFSAFSVVSTWYSLNLHPETTDSFTMVTKIADYTMRTKKSSCHGDHWSGALLCQDNWRSKCPSKGSIVWRGSPDYGSRRFKYVQQSFLVNATSSCHWLFQSLLLQMYIGIMEAIQWHCFG